MIQGTRHPANASPDDRTVVRPVRRLALLAQSPSRLFVRKVNRRAEIRVLEVIRLSPVTAPEVPDHA
jgi:hypothetical protein